MNIEDIRRNAKKNLKGFCNVCTICNGVFCAGQVPGMGGSGTGSSFKDNVNDLKDIKLILKTIHNNKKVNTNINLFGLDLNTPIIPAPVAGSEYNMGGALTEEDYVHSVVHGAIDSGTIAMLGDSAYPELYLTAAKVAKDSEGKAISIIKPRVDNNYIKKCFKLAEETNQLAVGIDIDSAGHFTMAEKNAPVSPKSFNELKELKASTNLPFILKGIMSPDEAILAVELGADAIVVSNHGGRILDDHPSTVSVLSSIAEKVKGRTTILVDGGIRSGMDVFKMLALGADAVLIGRPIIIAAFGGRRQGVSFIIDKFTKELEKSILLSGAKDIKSINKSMISF